MSRRKRYSAEFKREALRRANEPGVTDVLVAEELGISARQLRRWRDAVNRDGVDAFCMTSAFIRSRYSDIQVPDVQEKL